MKKDFLSDVRLASVTLSDLRAHLVAKGVAESHIKLASTKFALVALAEEKDLDLEELLSKIDEKTVNERQKKQRRVDALGKELETMQVAVNKDSEKHQIEVVQVAATGSASKASAVAVTPGLPIPAVRLSVRLDNGTVHYISLTVPRSAECG